MNLLNNHTDVTPAVEAVAINTLGIILYLFTTDFFDGTGRDIIKVLIAFGCVIFTVYKVRRTAR